MTIILFCLFEDENKNCVRWCYPPSFAENLTLPEDHDQTIHRVPVNGLIVILGRIEADIAELNIVELN